MWFKEYRDYPIDRTLIKEQVEPGKGIIGCEMHEVNGWGVTLHHHRNAQEMQASFKTGVPRNE
jgi:hypothetical protein